MNTIHTIIILILVYVNTKYNTLVYDVQQNVY